MLEWFGSKCIAEVGKVNKYLNFLLHSASGNFIRWFEDSCIDWIPRQGFFFFSFSTIRLNNLETGTQLITDTFEQLLTQFSVFGKFLVLLVSFPQDIIPSFLLISIYFI